MEVSSNTISSLGEVLGRLSTTFQILKGHVLFLAVQVEHIVMSINDCMDLRTFLLTMTCCNHANLYFGTTRGSKTI